MVIKKKFFTTRSKLIILVVIFIILIGYVVLTNLPPSINYKTPREVLKNPSAYIDKKIIVRGYLDKNNANYPIITNTMDTTNVRDELRVDYSNITNKDKLVEGTIYYFTGTIKTDLTNPSLSVVYMYLEKFETV